MNITAYLQNRQYGKSELGKKKHVDNYLEEKFTNTFTNKVFYTY